MSGRKLKKKDYEAALENAKERPLYRMRALLCDLKEWSPRSDLREMFFRYPSVERFR